MNILHVIPSLSERSGGPAQAIFPMCAALQEKGVEVSLVSTDEGLAERVGDGNSEGFQNYRNIRTKLFPVNWKGSFKYSRTLQTWLDRNVFHYDAVHIHAVFNHACLAAANACQSNDVPYVLRPLGTLDSWSMKQKKLKKQLFWQFAAKKMLRNAAFVQYTSEAEQQDSEANLNLKRGVVIPLGVNEVQAGVSLTRTDLPYLLLISRLVPTKNVHLLLESFLEVSERSDFAQWKLIIAGDGDAEYLKQLQQRVATQQAESKVLFKGWVDGARKVSLLQNAALFVLPSQHENFGISVMEAMACKVPVVVSPQVAMAATIKDANAGWITTTDPDNLKATLIEAMSNESERMTRGESALALSRQFSWSTIADQMIAMYHHIIEQRVLKTA
jgi:glycosyltransferase involved in cell wall biosynthesis